MRTTFLLGAAALLVLTLPGVPAPAAAPPVARPAIATAGRDFLAYDPDDGTAVEAIGDLDTATRVAVLVPGVGTRLADFDRGLGGVARRAPAVQARALYARMRGIDPAARVAVVAWLGYVPPSGLNLAAVREDRARTGARALVAFVRALLARRPGAAVTLVGHSYGALVVGLAAPHLPQVHDLVVLGAPGMGADRASALGGARVYSALARPDWMRRVPQLRLLGFGHGRRPSSPGFGATPLPTAGVAGHDYYLVPGSATLAAAADVVLGQPPDRVVTGTAHPSAGITAASKG
jgi:pimeloyl-ACP methyl ester carboxylesterase